MDQLGAKVIGISGDAVSNLKKFKQTNKLNFTLLSDVSGEIAARFGVSTNEGGTIVKKFGDQEIKLSRAYTPTRSTFILDSEGKIIYQDNEADFNSDHQKVIDFLKQYVK